MSDEELWHEIECILEDMQKEIGIGQQTLFILKTNIRSCFRADYVYTHEVEETIEYAQKYKQQLKIIWQLSDEIVPLSDELSDTNQAIRLENLLDTTNDFGGIFYNEFSHFEEEENFYPLYWEEVENAYPNIEFMRDEFLDLHEQIRVFIANRRYRPRY